MKLWRNKQGNIVIELESTEKEADRMAIMVFDAVNYQKIGRKIHPPAAYLSAFLFKEAVSSLFITDSYSGSRSEHNPFTISSDEIARGIINNPDIAYLTIPEYETLAKALDEERLNKLL